MDYDDDDFQSQNLRLAGEGNTKFPPLLRPYTLPKFDFDNSFQGPLRFDSLVETEVFLGIESQEGNHWIEDFSRASSGIEFSPRAAESCSISRCNNAWSEATSSESVEMLLKSVAQEVMIPSQTVKESGVQDEQGNLTEQTEPTLKQDDSTLTTMADVVDSGPTSPSGNISGSFPRLNEDAGGNPAQIDEAVQIHEGKLLTYRSPSDFHAGEPCGSPLAEGNLLADSKCNEVTHTEVGLSLHDFPVSRIEDLSAAEIRTNNIIDNLVTSSQNVITSIGEVNNQDASNCVCNKEADSFHSDNNDGGEESHCLSNKSVMDDQMLGVGAVKSCNSNMENATGAVSAVDSILERNVIEIVCKNVEEPSTMMLKGECDLQIAKGCTVDVCSGVPVQASKCEVMGVCKDKERAVQFEEGACDDPSEALERDSRSEQGHEACNSNGGTCAILELNMVSDTQYSRCSSFEKKGNLLESGHQMGSEIVVSNSEASLLSVEDTTILNCQSAESGINHVDDGPHSTLAYPSPELVGRIHGTETSKDVPESSGICRNELYSIVHVSSSIPDDSVPVIEKNGSSKLANVHNYDQDESVSGFIMGKVKLFTNVTNVECQGVGSVVTDGMPGSSSLGKCSTGNEVLVGNSKSDTTAENESASGIASEHGVPLALQDGVTNNESIDSKFNEKLPSPVVRSFNLDEIEKNGTNMSTESSLSVLSNWSEETTAMNIVSKDEKDAPSDTEQLVHGPTNQSLSVVESFKVESHSEAQAAVNTVSRYVSEDLDGSPVLCDSVLEDGNGEMLLPNDTEDKNATACYEVSSFNIPGKISNEGEMLTLPVPSCPKESGQEDEQTGLVSRLDNCGEIASSRSRGDALNAPEGFVTAASLPEVDMKSSAVEGGNSCESERPNCGSPTVISCVGLTGRERELHEGDKEPVDENLAVCIVNCGDSKDICSVSPDLKGNDASTDDKSFTFEVTPLADSSEREVGKSWQPFSTIQVAQVSAIVDGSYRSALSQMDSKLEQETTHGNAQTSDRQIVYGGSKSTDHKVRKSSGKAMRKVAAKRVDSRKEASPVKQFERGDKPCVLSPVLSTTSQVIQSERMLHRGNVGLSGTRRIGALTSGTSNLPDLNASTSTLLVFQQPFTDMQQLQLRGQIFVYGALILGAAPDEACMVAAFGASDGGRSIWENAWRECVERVHRKKSHPNNPERPLPSFPAGARPPDLANKQAPSSPLWSISTPSSNGLQRSTSMPVAAVLSPLHNYQSPPLQNFVGHTSWLSQALFLSPWVASQRTSALDANACFSTFPITEAVRSTPVRESSVAHSSGTMLVSSSPMAPSGISGGAFAGISSPIGIIKEMGSPDQHSTYLKPRKRKKMPVFKDLSDISLPSTSVVAKTDTFEAITAVSPSSTPAKKSIGLSEETLNKVEEAKLHAEDAAAHAATAVSCRQGIWTQLGKQKDCGLVSDVEASLASAAVAVAASASIAMAAVAAAKIASDAALQAKLMADEALAGSVNDSLSQSSGNSHSDGTSSANSVIVAAREVAQRRVEVASAVSKQAENFYALVKAAELVAEAVSQAGQIVAMGDPLPLSQLLEAGPEGYWKLPQASTDPVVKSNYANVDQMNIGPVKKGPANFAEGSERPVPTVETRSTSHGKPSTPRVSCRELMGGHRWLADGILDSGANSEKELRGQEDCKVSDAAKTIGVVPESEFGCRSAVINAPRMYEKAVDTLKEDSIKEGSLVEVSKDGDAYKGAWFLANVLSLEHGKACICYTKLPSDDGLAQLKEWVTVEGEVDKAPRVRITHPMFATRVEGTRKQQREAMNEYAWSVGDRVDAWTGDCWREGVITEMNKNDETLYTVSFPAEGQTSVVGAWHLQPSRIWKDGEWVEWSGSRESNSTCREGDMPGEKRPRLACSGVEAVAENKLSNSINVVEPGKPEESSLPILSANEKMFVVGKTSRDVIKPNRLKMQAGLQKERPGVIFGVPKPGKKRKFMDVSKHYIAGLSSKTNQVSDSAKPAKALMPADGSRSHVASRVDFSGKWVPESKLKPGKLRNVNSRTVSQKNKVLTSSLPTIDGTVANDLASIEDSDKHDENGSRKHNTTDVGSIASTKGRAEGPLLFSSSANPPDAPSSKKVSTSGDKSEHMNKGRAAPSDGKLTKIVEDKVFTGKTGKSTSEVVEPRRSNRRIQPTSRLLEGIQSSLIVPKTSSVSHDRAHKSQQRSVSRDKNFKL